MAMTPGPDLIVHNGRVATLDAAGSLAQALAVWRGRIIATGLSADMLSLAGPGTRLVDLRGRFACPAFTDCHVHLTWWALSAGGQTADLDGARSLAEALARVADLARRDPPGGWLRGRGWDKNHWAELRFPTAADLDRATGERPAAMASHDGHSVWANSAGLRAAGITPQTPDPPGGRILRDGHGRPTGVFQEAAAGLIWEALPDPSLEETVDALEAALPVAASLGIAGVHNCESGDAMGALQLLRARGKLTARVTRFVPAASLDALISLGLTSGFGDEWLRIGGVKAFLDGALGGQTAAMLAPYDGTGNAGVLTMEEAELEDRVERATGAGVAVALHAIGDRAVRLALDVFERVRARHPGAWPRHRLEHAQHVSPADVPRFAALGVLASVQPAHMLADIATCNRHLASRTAEAFPLRSLLGAGATLCLGSDAPVEIMDPLAGLRAAVERRGWDGEPAGGWHPEQRLSVAQALAGYTRGAALASGEEHLRGSLEAGKVADLVVLSEDILTRPEALADTRVLATVVGGETVHDPAGLLA
jgi:predicted amidohydrolase YtcJ